MLPLPSATSLLGSALDPAAAVASVKRWYHCIDVAPGLVTPGLFDLRPIVDQMPWPDVRGSAAWMSARPTASSPSSSSAAGRPRWSPVDLAAHEHWDLEAHVGSLGPEYLRAVAGPAAERRVRGGARAAHLLGLVSGAHRLRPQSRDPRDLRLVVCGSLLLHLRDPLRALRRSPRCAPVASCAPTRSTSAAPCFARIRPLVRLDGTSGVTQWWVPNAAGHRQMLRAVGFTVERVSCLYAIPFGPAHPPPSRRPSGLAHTLAQLLFTRREGVPHTAVLARIP